MHTIVYEDWRWQHFLPLTYTRALFQLRCGMGDLLARARRLHPAPGVWCRLALAELVAEQTLLATNHSAPANTLLLNGRAIWHALPPIQTDAAAWVGTIGSEGLIACIWADAKLVDALRPETLLDEARTRAALADLPRRDISPCAQLCAWPWDLVLANAECLRDDWSHLGHRGELLGQLDQGTYILEPTAVHIGRGARLKPGAVIDAENGPVYIGERAQLMPHTYVQGPCYIGDGTLLQPGAVVHEGTSIGPVCKVGGEIEASIIQGYSNKQHDGFLGHSYIGSWVNIAADCVNSDLKNTYGSVRVPINGHEVDSGETFVGMLMGDHSKAGINVSFPTGAVIGFCSSIFAARSPKFVPSFAWIDGERGERYDEKRGLAIARKVMARRQQTMSPAEERAFLAVARQALGIERQELQRFSPEY